MSENEKKNRKKKKSGAGAVFIILVIIIAILLLLIWMFGIGGGSGGNSVGGGSGNGDVSESVSDTVTEPESETAGEDEGTESAAEIPVNIVVSDSVITVDGSEVDGGEGLREYILSVNTPETVYVLTDDHALKSAYDDAKAVLDELECSYSQAVSDSAETDGSETETENADNG